MLDLVSVLSTVNCGGITEIDSTFPALTSAIVTFIKVFVPVIIVILGMIDLAKAVIASKEDEMKKAQSILIKRIIYGVVIFFVFTIVQIIFSIDALNGENSKSCLNCFINNDCTSVETK